MSGFLHIRLVGVHCSSHCKLQKKHQEIRVKYQKSIDPKIPIPCFFQVWFGLWVLRSWLTCLFDQWAWMVRQGNTHRAHPEVLIWLVLVGGWATNRQQKPGWVTAEIYPMTDPWCWYINANIKGVYWWDPWHTIYTSTGMIRHGYIPSLWLNMKLQMWDSPHKPGPGISPDGPMPYAASWC